MPTALARNWAHAEPEVMEMTGRLDSANAAMLEGDAMLCIQSGAQRMVLDCSRLSYISAGGLRMILMLAHEMEKTQGKLAVCDLQPQVSEMFIASGMDAFVTVYEDQSEALTALAA